MCTGSNSSRLTIGLTLNLEFNRTFTLNHINLNFSFNISLGTLDNIFMPPPLLQKISNTVELCLSQNASTIFNEDKPCNPFSWESRDFELDLFIDHQILDFYCDTLKLPFYSLKVPEFCPLYIVQCPVFLVGRGVL